MFFAFVTIREPAAIAVSAWLQKHTRTATALGERFFRSPNDPVLTKPGSQQRGQGHRVEYEVLATGLKVLWLSDAHNASLNNQLGDHWWLLLTMSSMVLPHFHDSFCAIGSGI